MVTKNWPSSDCYFFPADFIDDDCLNEHPYVCVCVYTAKTQCRRGKEPSA